jgi:hypothetical protein
MVIVQIFFGKCKLNMKQLCAILMILLFSVGKEQAFAQDSTVTKKEYRLPLLWNIEAAYHFQGSQAVELGINFTRYLYNLDDLADMGSYFSCEYYWLKEGKNILAPKIGIGFNQMSDGLKGWGYAVRLNVLWLDPGRANDWRFLPQAGLTWAGIFNVYYGYQVPLAQNRFSAIGPHRVSVTLNIGYVRSLINIIELSGGM